jgi:hemoglobin
MTSDISTSNQTADTKKGELTVEGKPASLYARLGGYDAIAAVVDDLLPRLRSDALLSRFWTSARSVDTLNRERQLAVDFIAAAAGGPTFYLGRDMRISHKGMGITKADYAAFMRCLGATMDKFEVSEPERSEVVVFVTGLEPEIVEA